MDNDTLLVLADRDEDALPLPSFEGIVARTVALMTSWAAHAHEPSNTGSPDNLIARKIVSNLFFMAHPPQAQGPLACALVRARDQWVELAREPTVSVEAVNRDRIDPESSPLH